MNTLNTLDLPTQTLTTERSQQSMASLSSFKQLVLRLYEKNESKKSETAIFNQLKSLHESIESLGMQQDLMMQESSSSQMNPELSIFHGEKDQEEKSIETFIGVMERRIKWITSSSWCLIDVYKEQNPTPSKSQFDDIWLILSN